MTFEFVPPTLNPEMSYSDIATVIALFFTAVAFAFSMWQWNKNRKSEQIKIASEVFEKIEETYRELMKIEIFEPVKSDSPDKYKQNYFEITARLVRYFRFFSFLKESNQINKKDVLKYYSRFITPYSTAMNRWASNYNKFLNNPNIAKYYESYKWVPEMIKEITEIWSAVNPTNGKSTSGSETIPKKGSQI